MSGILHLISHNALVVFDENHKRFEVLTSPYRAAQKYCLMLDVCLPLKDKHEAQAQLITKEMLVQKEKMENILGTKMEIVEPCDPDHPFTHGFFISLDEESDIRYSDDCLF